MPRFQAPAPFLPLLVAGVALTACGSPPVADPTKPAPAQSASRAPVNRADTAKLPVDPGTSTPATHERQPITLSFAGDIQFEDHVRPRLDSPATALAPIKEQLQAADLTIANLETAITTRGRAEDKTYTFRASPAAFDALDAAGVDVVTMANNHGVDYGPQGLSDTLAAIKRAPLAVVGIGANADQAFAPHVATIRGTKVAVIAATAFNDPTARNYPAGPNKAGVAAAVDPERLLAEVRSVRRAADVVVVFLHWGIEQDQCPSDQQRSLAEELAQTGADIVIGSHAHVLHAGRLAGYDTYVAYGLGNFVWRNRRSVQETITGLLTLTVDGRKVTAAQWSPAIVGASGLPGFTHGDEAERMRRDFADLRGCADLDAVPASRTAAHIR
ncbi:CapA family protein [Actinopolymorpha pittospori]|uniref:Poly-gamma-glutamate synthesis protein (Capsule biosynthesis protein) n=1 Tax=Actinopolymorpha pittospori TaxID=648752 RepID=A0A927R6F0_9ACTN|nr:poly-gamma-glutamate synthesis protein (capsule biosynthesis protein) [Actinopolymorpha pittospori]